MPREQVPSRTRTLGIDLASQPKDTGVCLIEWDGKRGEVIALEKKPPKDDVLIAMMLDPAVSKVGIDAPFGWPLAFIDAISSYRDTGAWLDLEPNEMRFRATDSVVAQRTGQNPLSVAMSDLAWPAMRCARLLSGIASEAGTLDRTGAGLVAEVYPMAALRQWHVITPGTPPTEWSYKGDAPGRRQRREQHFSALQRLLGDNFSISDDCAALCISDDDDFDALISALVARCVELSITEPIPRGMRWAAMREGWIHLPTAASATQLA